MCLTYKCVWIFVLFVLAIQSSYAKRHKSKNKLLGEGSDDEWHIEDTPKFHGDRRRPSDFLLPPIHDDTALSSKLHTESITPLDFLVDHNKYFDAQNSAYDGEKLLYVTPWHKKGYDFATIIAAKLTFLAPVWFQIRKNLAEDRKKNRGMSIYVEGEGSADLPWLRSINTLTKSCGLTEVDCSLTQRVLFVPRVALECQLDSPLEIQETAAVLVQLMTRLEAQDAKIDGFTLEVPLDQMNAAITICNTLRQLQPGIKIVIVLPPVMLESAKTNAGQQGRKALQALAQAVDRISVMTYDKARDGMPIAPLPWVRQVMSSLLEIPAAADKLLLGLPFYGWRNSEDMTAEKMVVWLATDASVTVRWDPTSAEHYFVDARRRRASYPTPYMLKLRIQLAKEMRLRGVAIWEGGQGLAANIDVL